MATDKPLFQQALVALKGHIERIGSKNFSLSGKGEWPLKNDNLNTNDNELYRLNAFQALWNITDTFHRAAAYSLVPGGQFYVLLANRAQMTAWFDYLEPKKGSEIHAGDGTLRILDDSTYELGKHLYEFFILAIENKYANELLTKEGITPFKRIKDTLKIRLDKYAAKGALEAYKDQINNAVDVEKIPLPDVLHVTDGNTLAYHIDLVALDTPDAANTNIQAYTALLNQLLTYAASLTDKSKEIEHQIKGFDAAHVLPKEATPNTKEEFVAARDAAKAKLHSIQEHLQVQHDEVKRLIAEVKANCRVLNNQGQQGAFEEQHEKLLALQAVIDERAAIAEASLKAYQIKKSTATASNATPILDSSKSHGKILQSALAELNQLEEDIKKTFRQSTLLAIPSAETLISALGYTADEDRRIVTELHKKMHDISQVNFVTKGKEHARAINDFRAHIASKLENIKAESKAKSTLALDEYQSRHDALALRQAQLNLHLTDLEFRLEAIAPQERSLEELMGRITPMSASVALERIAEDKDSVLQLKAWFKATTDAQPTSSLDLYKTIQGSIAAQDQDRGNIELLRVNSGVPGQASLDNEHQALAEKSKKIMARYQALQEAIEAFDAKEKSLQDQSLQTAIACSVDILQKIETQEAWTTDDKQQTFDDICQQLEMLRRSVTYFADVPDAPLEQIYEHQTKLIQAKTSLEQKMCTIVSVPLDPADQLAELKNTYFGKSYNVEGVFGAYLKERHKTFWFRDFMGQVAAVLLGCFSYKTTASIRTAYIASLQSCMNNCNDEPQNAEKLATLNTLVDKGLKDFKPRTWKQQEYEKSLHAKLTVLKTALSNVNKINAPTAEDDIAASDPAQGL